jgi:hypothetical protein
MREVTLEVEQAIKTLQLSQEIISKTETGFNESLYFNLLEKFVIGKDRSTRLTSTNSKAG